MSLLIGNVHVTIVISQIHRDHKIPTFWFKKQKEFKQQFMLPENGQGTSCSEGIIKHLLVIL